MAKEALARIKINQLLTDSGWRFFDDESGKANVVLEENAKFTKNDLDQFGNDFEKTSNGSIDFLLLDENLFPFIVLEAKKESIHPLNAKEQARDYAMSKKCRYIILSNGNIHYFWDIENGNPRPIGKFPALNEVKGYQDFEQNKSKYQLSSIDVDKNYIIQTQFPGYKDSVEYKSGGDEWETYKWQHELKELREYQVNAIKSIQNAQVQGKNRFLFEMATGTGKTLTTAAVCKLFLQTGNAERILFLVDRIELEQQALKAFKKIMGNSYSSCIYKQNKSRSEWSKYSIVITTVQSLLVNNRYIEEFLPTDFQLVISDEAHRSISGDARAVFEYFVGYKLGLTATPRDYLKGIDYSNTNTQKEFERRQLLDTYKTFGCESGDPTFRYDLLAGVKDGFLVNPEVIQIKTEITTQLLSEEGYAVHRVVESEESEEEIEEIYGMKHFEKQFFNEETNKAFCKSFIENASRDPITNEIGKSLVFCVSQNHAAKITNILNEIATEMFPEQYGKGSFFAKQVTSNQLDSQSSTTQFTENQLGGKGSVFLDEYITSKTRVCVTVGMMTTGYDCPDLLNVVIMRPVFSPSEFIQIKGRGTRKHKFELKNDKGEVVKSEKKSGFKLFDYFEVYRYFEEDFDYNEQLNLPAIHEPILVDPIPPTITGIGVDNPKLQSSIYIGNILDQVSQVVGKLINEDGMKVDREAFRKFVEDLRNDEKFTELFKKDPTEAGNYIVKEKFDKPHEFVNLEKVKNLFNLGRRISISEFVDYVMGKTKEFKSREEDIQEKFQYYFDKLNSDYLSVGKEIDVDQYNNLEKFFEAYITDIELQQIIDSNSLGKLVMVDSIDPRIVQSIDPEIRQKTVQYIKDYINVSHYR